MTERVFARQLHATPGAGGMAVQSLSLIPGATDRSAIMPFWRAVLAHEPRAGQG